GELSLVPLGVDDHSELPMQVGCQLVRVALLGHAAGVAVVGFAGGRLQYVAGDDHGGFREEWIDRRGDRVGHQGHVGLVDRLPAGDRGAVEHQALGENFFVDHADVEGHMLPLAARIGETQVDVFHVIVLDRFLSLVSTAGNSYDADYFGDTSKFPKGLRAQHRVPDDENWDETIFNVFKKHDGVIRHFWGLGVELCTHGDESAPSRRGSGRPPVESARYDTRRAWRLFSQGE